MPRVARLDCESKIHHITARGVGRRIIFENDVDRVFLYNTIAKLVDELDVDLYAWCFMTNHIHFLARGEMQDISKLMQRMTTSYSMHFNGRHGHVGHVFQSRFGSKPIADDNQFLMTLCYIHQNPIRSKERSDYNFKWSSYLEYTNPEMKGLCNISFALDMLGGKEAFVCMHENLLGLSSVPLSNYHARLNDAEAQRLIEELIGPDYGTALALMPKPERDAKIRTLRSRNISIRQIERLTGIGRNIIQRA